MIPFNLVSCSAAIQVMESCNLVFTPTTEDAESAFNSGPNHNSSGKGRRKGGYGSNNKNKSDNYALLLSDRLTYVLDPAIELLVSYSPTLCEELGRRHIPIIPELKEIIYTEQRKYSISLKVSPNFVFILLLDVILNDSLSIGVLFVS